MKSFKVGDRVVVVNKNSRFNMDHGVITTTMHHMGEHFVRLDHEDEGWYFFPDELEHEETYEALSAAPEALIASSDAPIVASGSDPVNHPSHYTWLPNGLEVIDITSQFSFSRGNALKYLMRADHKGKKLEDLKKALWYVLYEIDQLEKESK